jgi:CheY-like chemotaxis protein
VQEGILLKNRSREDTERVRFHLVTSRRADAMGESVGANRLCGQETVLLVDDDPLIVHALRWALGTLGYEVVACTDSVEALRIFQADPHAIDAVVTDHAMPQLVGLEMARKMLRIRPQLPVVLCTGSLETVDRPQAKAMGIRELLLKPVSINALDRAIRRALAPGPPSLPEEAEMPAHGYAK